MNSKGQFFPLRDVNESTGTSPVNWILIAVNCIVFLFSLVAFESIISTYGFTPGTFSLITVFTSMFLHGGIAHLLGNMWFLYIFGDNVEHAYGHFTYLVFYLLAGVAATLIHFLFNIGSTIPAVGASGAISGVLGAYLVLYPRARVYVTGGLHAGQVSAKFMLLLWFGFQFLSGVLGYFGTQSGVAFWAHVGGFVFGVVFAWIYRAASGARGRGQ
jgi:membrane associated rhomboid family serine protease